MNIIRFLKDQHHEAKNALIEIIVRNDAGESRSLLEKLSKMLRLHMQIEETIIYPAASGCFQGDLRKPSVFQSFEEHALAKQCLSSLESTPPTDEHFVDRAKVLKGLISEHILEEETDLFPSLEAKLGQSGINRLGHEVERLLSKLEAESAPRPAAPAATEPPAMNSQGAKVAQTERPATKSRGAKVAQTKRPATKSRRAKAVQATRSATKSGRAETAQTTRSARKARSAEIAQARSPAARSRSASVAQTRRQRSTVRGAKGSRKPATARGSARRH